MLLTNFFNMYTFISINDHPKRMFFIMCLTKKRNRKIKARQHLWSNKNISEKNQCWTCLLNVESFEADHILYGSALNDVTILWRKGSLWYCKRCLSRDETLVCVNQKVLNKKVWTSRIYDMITKIQVKLLTNWGTATKFIDVCKSALFSNRTILFYQIVSS